MYNTLYFFANLLSTLVYGERRMRYIAVFVRKKKKHKIMVEGGNQLHTTMDAMTYRYQVHIYIYTRYMRLLRVFGELMPLRNGVQFVGQLFAGFRHTPDNICLITLGFQSLIFRTNLPSQSAPSGSRWAAAVTNCLGSKSLRHTRDHSFKIF